MIPMKKLFFRSDLFVLFIFLSLTFSMITSMTLMSWNHPDEWYQTVEFANYIAFKKLTYSPEVINHLRNLSWPMILAVPMKIMGTIFSDHLKIITFSIQFFCVLLNLIVVWGIYSFIKAEKILDHFKIFEKNIFWFFILLAPFFIADATRPSQEHLCVIGLWLSIGLIYKKKPFLAGIFTISILAFKYPAGLLSLGLVFYVLFLIKENKSFKRNYFFGLIFGLLIWGIPDLIYYGRPWESFWMYFQYNILMGLSHKNFGSQSFVVYFSYFRGQWSTLFIIGAILVFYSLFYIKNYFKNLLIIILPLSFYLLGHLLISHKEPRFMVPLDYPFMIFSLLGVMKFFRGRVIWNKLLVIIILINTVLILKVMKGDFLKSYHSFYSYYPNESACATIGLNRPYGYYFNNNKTYGFHPYNRKDDFNTIAINRPIEWLGQKPICTDHEKVFIQTYNEIDFFKNNQCELLPQYFLSTDTILILAKKKWLSGIWWNCPSLVLDKFPKENVRNVLVNQFIKIENLPKLGDSGDVILNRQKEIEMKNNWWIGSFPEW